MESPRDADERAPIAEPSGSDTALRGTDVPPRPPVDAGAAASLTLASASAPPASSASASPSPVPASGAASGSSGTDPRALADALLDESIDLPDLAAAFLAELDAIDGPLPKPMNGHAPERATPLIAPSLDIFADLDPPEPPTLASLPAAAPADRVNQPEPSAPIEREGSEQAQIAREQIELPRALDPSASTERSAPALLAAAPVPFALLAAPAPADAVSDSDTPVADAPPVVAATPDEPSFDATDADTPEATPTSWASAITGVTPTFESLDVARRVADGSASFEGRLRDADSTAAYARQLALAAMPSVPVAPENSDLRRHVVFSLGHVRCAVPIDQVLEVGPIPSAAPVPHAPAWIHGMGNLRGQVVALIDLCALFGVGRVRPQNGRMVLLRSTKEDVTAGVMVDQVHPILELPVTQIGPTPQGLPPGYLGYVRGSYLHDETTVAALDVDRVIGADEAEGES